MKEKKAIIYYIFALFVIGVWATTFISSKVLLNYMQPTQLMFMRFIIAYLSLLAVYPKIEKPHCLKDELLFLLAGITGGSVYYLAENYALKFSWASNVSLLITTAPILTAILAHFFTGHKLTKNLVIGFFVAFTGVFLVVYSGSLQLRLWGDLLAIAAALCWAVYSVTVTKMSTAYNGIIITRRIFLYAILTLLPVLPFIKEKMNFTVLKEPVVVANLLFLGLIASSVCYLLWNSIMGKIGIVKANNFIYLTPLVTIVASAIVLGEVITWRIVLGGIFILLGVYLSERKPS
ncbi:MAG: DMT family transporter [Oscillospiraceae bacterium]|nr:DMT family transporter [Oscillospiraceae bacterium]